jgi:hypothetical protein
MYHDVHRLTVGFFGQVACGLTSMGLPTRLPITPCYLWEVAGGNIIYRDLLKDLCQIRKCFSFQSKYSVRSRQLDT